MKLRNLYKKVLAVMCAITMVVATCAGTGSFSVKAEEAEDIFVDSAVHNYGDVTEHAYNYGWLCGAKSEYQYLIMTYTGDITNLRLQLVKGEDRLDGLYWVNPEQESHLALVGDPVLTSEEGATIVIDLKATGMDLDKADAMDMHYGPGTLNIGYARLSQSAEINPEVDVMPEPEEDTDAEEDMTLEGLKGVWAPEATEGYAYLTGVDVGYSGYGYLQLTYKGDETAFNDLRLGFDGAGKTLGFVNPYDGKLVTVDGTDVPAPTSEEQTVIIDLEESGLDLDAVINKIHMHQTAGNGSFEITDAKLLVDYDDGSDDPDVTTGNTEDNTLEDLILNGDENGQSSMMKSFSCSQEYKYLGFATLKEPTEAYKYLILTYAGDISTVRFEFASVVNGNEDTNKKIGPYWFNKEGQTKYFVTADESDIPLNGGKGTTIVIDLEKSGITLGDLNSVHMHGGDPNVASFSLKIGMARLSTKPDVLPVDVMPAEGETTTPKQTTTAKKDDTTSNVKAPGRVTIKKATKKKSAKKASITLKKVNGAKGYLVQISTSKKFKKVLVKKTTKSLKVTLTSKKLKGKKKLYVRAKAYKLNGKKKVYSKKWSTVKKIKVK